MNGSESWKDDPLVVIQDAVLPVLTLAQQILLHAALGTCIPDSWDAAFDKAQYVLRSNGTTLLKRFGVVVSPQDQRVFDGVADVIATTQTMLKQLDASAPDRRFVSEAHTQVIAELHPAVHLAIERYRALFISFVIARQTSHARQSNVAINQLEKISKQIFFISINASVEAARVGDEGRGFAQISTDIRALSQSAQDATRDLSNIADTNAT